MSMKEEEIIRGTIKEIIKPFTMKYLINILNNKGIKDKILVCNVMDKLFQLNKLEFCLKPDKYGNIQYQSKD